LATEGQAELQQLLGEDGMRRFLRVYLNESKRRLREMVDATLNGDVQAVREAVHALLPTSRWVGATGVAEVCEALHSRKDWEELTREHAELVLRIAELHGAWEQQLQSQVPDIGPLFQDRLAGEAPTDAPPLR
jgi:HPt (histidine-containing phosphotransfer) domain-containing protein